jgi:REP element-mobilizing transposase RayT
MARRPRVHFPGALYHVISRGNQRQKIFRSTSDRARYLELLSRYHKRYGFVLYAYVLMSNHVHLLMEAGTVSLSKVLQGLQQSYTLYFNRKYGLVGHLFQGRYKAILCDRDAYLLELVRYLHLNPVRSRVVTDPAEYEWSSHQLYLGKRKRDDGLVQTEWVLGQLAQNHTAALKQYRQFILDGYGEGHRGELYEVKEQQYLGDDQFVERLNRTIDSEPPELIRISLSEIEEVVCRKYEVAPAVLRSRSKERRGSFGRLVVAHLGQELGGLKLNEIAKQYGRDQVTLSLGLKRLRERMAEDAVLRQSVQGLEERLRKGK